MDTKKLEIYKNQIGQFISDFVENLKIEDNSCKIKEMLEYVLLNNSKKLRASFILLFGEIFEIPAEILKNYCVAIELMHSYTLVHDDLPAIDNDKMRRGKPATHLAFGEANAILLGDGLNTIAFELCAETNNYFNQANILNGVANFAKTMGMINGVVFGQFIDINNMKTG